MARWTQILGQDQAVEVLRRAFFADKLAHAYLFTGPAGVGKATCATVFAAALNCTTAPGEGCDRCTACLKIAGGLHPDLLRIAPDGAQIKIAQVRELEEHLAFQPHEGRYRLVLIDGADQLTDSAANALLKSVEEPRQRTMFVLVASAGHLVTPTLVSRCQQIRFLPLERATVLQILAHQSDAAAEQQEAAATLAEGSAQRALRLLEGEQMLAVQQSVAGLLQAAQGKGAVEMFEAAAAAGRDREQLQEVLEVIRVWLRDLLLCREGLEERRVVHVDQLARLQQEAQRTTRPTLLRQLRVIDETQAAIQGNVNPTLALEHLILGMRQARA